MSTNRKTVPLPVLVACLMLFALPLSSAAEKHFQIRGGIPRSLAAFEAAPRARVAFLGGSITHNPGWRDMTANELQRRHPDTEFDFINAGIPSMGSTPGAFRLHRDVLSHGPVDLLFVEAAVNDSTNGRTEEEMIRAMEGIVRQARTAQPQIDIVMMHFADPDKLSSYRNGKVPPVIERHERVAERYAIPSLNMALEVTDRIDAGEFTWKDDFKDLHPSPFGQRLYFKSIARFLDAASDAASHTASAQTANRSLPDPIDPASYDQGRLIPPDRATLPAGWNLDRAWKPKDGKGTRKGFVNVPMAIWEGKGTGERTVLKFNFEGNAVGLFVAAGPDAGMLDFRVDGGAWTRLDLFTPWSGSLHLPWLHVLAAGLPASEHTIEIRPVAARNSKSKGNAIRIAHFAVNGRE